MQNYHNNAGGTRLAGRRFIDNRIKQALKGSELGQLMFDFYAKVTQKNETKEAEPEPNGVTNNYTLLFKELYKKSVSSRSSQN